ncbi:MAG: hypothetical protein LBU12_05750 [Deltaproteobacteria bacterium]|nr:hypothetical protein [Deltaproteobacteria bacterium]
MAVKVVGATAQKAAPKKVQTEKPARPPQAAEPKTAKSPAKSHAESPAEKASAPKGAAKTLAVKVVGATAEKAAPKNEKPARPPKAAEPEAVKSHAESPVEKASAPPLDVMSVTGPAAVLSADDELLERAGLFFGRGGGPRSRRIMLAAAQRRREATGLSPEGYLALLRNQPEEWRAIWDLCGPLPGDSFFRFPAQFEALTELVLERAATAPERSLRALVVGAGSGCEPCSLAMALAGTGLRALGWRLSLTVLEQSPELVRRAAAAVFAPDELRWLAPGLAKRWFGARGGGLRFKTELGPPMNVLLGNLVDEASLTALDGRFDVIFCRGWTFECPDRHARRLARQVMRLLAEDGLLFLAPGELWALGPGRRLEERAGVVYVRGEAPGGKRNVFHRPRRRGGRQAEPNFGASDEPTPRARSLTDRFWEVLAAEPDEARDLALELLTDDQGEGRLNLANWKLMRQVELALGRQECAAALASFIAAMSDGPHAVDRR